MTLTTQQIKQLWTKLGDDGLTPYEFAREIEATIKASGENKIVPLEPTPAMLDVAVSFALNVQISRDYNWSAYMADVYRRMIAAA